MHAAAGGAVAEDLTDALDWIRDGTQCRTALEQLAVTTAEPAAARVYRLLATSDPRDGDTLTTTRLESRATYAEQREEIETRRSSAGRSVAVGALS